VRKKGALVRVGAKEIVGKGLEFRRDYKDRTDKTWGSDQVRPHDKL
jgi:hypothetical protein